MISANIGRLAFAGSMLGERMTILLSYQHVILHNICDVTNICYSTKWLLDPNVDVPKGECLGEY